MIAAVSELTRFNFDEIFSMPAMDFLMYIRFINIRNRKEYLEKQREVAQMKAMINRHR